ncbi:MAG: hypothetical protein PHC95_01640 [Parabacteroides sp.]|nr:hypothetical protein [Parabacteroides sp.]
MKTTTSLTRFPILISLFLFLCNSMVWAWDFAEHRKIGDRAMLLLPTRLVEAGIFPDEEAAYAALSSLVNMSLGEDGKAFVMNELTQSPNLVTYGTLCGLSGDHVANPLLLETGLQTRFSKTNRTLLLEQKAMDNFLTGASSKELLSVNLAYGILAIKDLSHFYSYGDDLNEHLAKIDPDLICKMSQPANINKVFNDLNKLPSMSKYFCIHIFAMYLAEEAGRAVLVGDQSSASDLMFYATLYEAFAEHFLQDSFASGHQMVRRGFGLSSISNNKSLHDFYNTIPVHTANLKGETWSAYGDKRLNQNMLEYKKKTSYTDIRVSDKHPYQLPKGDPYERETHVFSQVVNATCQSALEVWLAYNEVLQGSDRDILKELPEKKEDVPAYIYANYPVVREFPIPFGTKLDEVPLDSAAQDRKEELQLIVQRPFTRNFIRSRVANSFSLLLGDSWNKNTAGVIFLGARLNLSMLNWHQFGNGEGMMMKAGDIAHWINPTISGYYMLTDEDDCLDDNWNIKGGLNYNMDIFVSPKRFLGLYSYMEVGVDRRNEETRFVVAPSLGVQLGSLIGLHTFNLPGWARIPLGLILPLKFTVTCNKVAGRPVEWLNTFEVELLF